jgi:hypothetical protein
MHYNLILKLFAKSEYLTQGVVEMNIVNIPFTVTDWESLPIERRSGASGESLWRIFEMGNIRIQLADYLPGYMGDHWCSKGHVLLVLEGELITELKDGRRFVLTAGMSWQAADEDGEHRSYTEKGAKLFIVD